MIKPTFMISEDCIVKEPIRSQLLAVSLADGASPKMKVTIISITQAAAINGQSLLMNS